MQFTHLKTAVSKQFDLMKQHDLFRVQVDKDLLWSTYLDSFPEGTNPLFRERTEHDCTCCRQFIRAAGDMVAIIDGKLVSIWDVEVGGFYQVVADALSALVKAQPIDNFFLHTEPSAGTDKNYQQTETGTLTWEHFYIKLIPVVVVRGADIGPKLAEFRSTKDVMLRGLSELTMDSIDTVLELIAQNSLYRGEEHTFAVKSFRTLKKTFDKLQTAQEKDLFCWSQVKSLPQSVSRIRNTSIGTLLTKLSDGTDLEAAVASFEAMVAPTNYKRPTALITKAMIEKAQKQIEELGLTSALERRYATIEDITINNILFANREARTKMAGNVFEELAGKVPEKVKNLEKVEEVTIENFLANILPKAESLEVMFENRHTGNLVSLIAPSDPAAKGMFKWPNKFSWSYNGELADSIKERVKAAGGNVTGDVCCRLAWYNTDDLDFHMREPDGNTIYYRVKRTKSRCGGMLDVDANGGDGLRPNPVENIFYQNRRDMKDGVYYLVVNQFSQRMTSDVGFEVEIDILGTVHHFAYPKAVRQKESITVAELLVSKGEVTVVPRLPSSQSVKEVWNIPTQTFHKVNVLMLSPNHWDGYGVGNKHYFFMLDGCLNDGKARGFFNEFLSAELDQHRKVLEVVGSKMKAEESNNQLSGLGFSSTQRSSVLCRVKGSFTRTVKIVF